jgi:hypothetical protein
LRYGLNSGDIIVADADVLRRFGDQISEQTVESERRQQQTADAEARRAEDVGGRRANVNHCGCVV